MSDDIRKRENREDEKGCTETTNRLFNLGAWHDRRPEGLFTNV